MRAELDLDRRAPYPSLNYLEPPVGAITPVRPDAEADNCASVSSQTVRTLLVLCKLVILLERFSVPLDVARERAPLRVAVYSQTATRPFLCVECFNPVTRKVRHNVCKMVIKLGRSLKTYPGPKLLFLLALACSIKSSLPKPLMMVSDDEGFSKGVLSMPQMM